MFTYNKADDSFFDSERDIRAVPAAGGPGHGVYSADVSGPGWTFRLGIRRDSDQYTFVNDQPIENPNYGVKLNVWALPVKGELSDPDLPGQIAREIALLLESELYNTDPDRVTIK